METDSPEQVLSRQLLEWYDCNWRELPWRVTPTLYRTVVSEFMLQQTQVKTVLPYFERWIQAFPDFESLASASEENVLKQWEGLGYYRRARNLHSLAKELVQSEQKPETYPEWLKFPGVGPYMAAAISSIAFHQPCVVVDGNVIRVICRLKALDEEYTGAAQAAKAVRTIAQGLLDPQRPGDFNQAIMELGAVICRPRNPDCPQCPWQAVCGARTAGQVDSIPCIRKVPTIRLTRPRLLVVDHRQRCILLVKDGMKGRLKGMYELPLLDEEKTGALEWVSTIKRGISNEIISEPIYQADLKRYTAFVQQKTEPVWIPFESINEVSVSGPHRKWLSDFLASTAGNC